MKSRRLAYMGAGLLALHGLFLFLPTAIAQPTGSTSGYDKNWITGGRAEATGKIDVALIVAPLPLVYGQVHDATIEVANGTANDREVQIKALLGEVPHFVSGDSGVRFENPDQAEQERKLVWPTRVLPAGARGRVGFQFLVSWETNGDVYIQVDVVDPSGAAPTAVDHIRATPQFASGNGFRWVQYGIMAIPFLFFVAWLFAMRRSARAGQRAGIFRVLMVGGAAILIFLAVTSLWESLEKYSWQATTCEVLDVRYSVQTTTSSTGTNAGISRKSTTQYSYTPTVTLQYEWPEGLMISSAYRSESDGSTKEDPGRLAVGNKVECFYDPDDPAWVIVERGFSVSSVFWSLLFVAIGVVLLRFGLRKRAPA